jgi:hypothetical protein
MLPPPVVGLRPPYALPRLGAVPVFGIDVMAAVVGDAVRDGAGIVVLRDGAGNGVLRCGVLGLAATGGFVGVFPSIPPPLAFGPLFGPLPTTRPEPLFPYIGMIVLLGEVDSPRGYTPCGAPGIIPDGVFGASMDMSVC